MPDSIIYLAITEINQTVVVDYFVTYFKKTTIFYTNYLDSFFDKKMKILKEKKIRIGT